MSPDQSQKSGLNNILETIINHLSGRDRKKFDVRGRALFASPPFTRLGIPSTLVITSGVYGRSLSEADEGGRNWVVLRLPSCALPGDAATFADST